jgi:tRNA-dihydrouridine synthase A
MLIEKTSKTEPKPLNSRDTVDRRFSIAPMMDWTNSKKTP